MAFADHRPSKQFASTIIEGRDLARLVNLPD
jgi:hypothetical protein